MQFVFTKLICNLPFIYFYDNYKIINILTIIVLSENQKSIRV